VDTKDKMQQYK